jgi:uncharacterized protein (DUF3820 family)
MVKMGKARVPKIKYVMNFGKYDGEYLEDIPTDYLEWLYNQPGFKAKNPRLSREILKVLEDDNNSNTFADSEYDDDYSQLDFDDDDMPF